MDRKVEEQEDFFIAASWAPLQPDWLGFYQWRKKTYTEGHTRRCKVWLSRNPKELSLVNALRLQNIACRRVRFLKKTLYTSVMAQTGLVLDPELKEFSETSVTPGEFRIELHCLLRRTLSK